jgi:hypothetical protein
MLCSSRVRHQTSICPGELPRPVSRRRERWNPTGAAADEAYTPGSRWKPGTTKPRSETWSSWHTFVLLALGSGRPSYPQGAAALSNDAVADGSGLSVPLPAAGVSPALS